MSGIFEQSLRVELKPDPLRVGELVVVVSKGVVEDGKKRHLDLHMRLRDNSFGELSSCLERMGCGVDGDSVLIAEVEG